MIRTAVILLGFASLAWCENSLTRQERKEGFQLLFDGKSLAQWHSIKLRPDAGPWRVRKGILTYQSGESWLATDETYSDFVLRLDYRTNAAPSDSGIFLRSGPTGNPGSTGMEIEIISDAGKAVGTHSTGAVWNLVAPSKSANKPDGQWNQVEITLVKRQLSAVWNGDKVLDISLDDPKYPRLATKSPFGHIGLQSHANGTPVEYRNIRIKVIKIAPQFLPELKREN
jgi:hypothetical protein